MKVTRRVAVTAGLTTVLSNLGLSRAHAQFGGIHLNPIEGVEDFWHATDAYIYGYPLVTVEMTRRVITNASADEGTRGPMGQIINLRQYPNASFRDVTAPNADTLLSTAFFDVGNEPWVFSFPADA